MSEKTKLSDNHRRVISSRVQMIDRNISELKQMLMQSERSLLDQRTELMAHQKKEMMKQLEAIHVLLTDLAKRYQLKFYKKSQRAIILSKLSSMLDVAEDMYAEKLIGYGPFQEELKEEYDEQVQQLEQAIKQTFKPFKKS